MRACDVGVLSYMALNLLLSFFFLALFVLQDNKGNKCIHTHKNELSNIMPLELRTYIQLLHHVLFLDINYMNGIIETTLTFVSI